MTTHTIAEFQIVTDDELMAVNGSGVGTRVGTKLIRNRLIPAFLPGPAGTPGPQPNPDDAEPQQNESCGKCPNWEVATPGGFTFTKY